MGSDQVLELLRVNMAQGPLFFWLFAFSEVGSALRINISSHCYDFQLKNHFRKRKMRKMTTEHFGIVQGT